MKTITRRMFGLGAAAACLGAGASRAKARTTFLRRGGGGSAPPPSGVTAGQAKLMVDDINRRGATPFASNGQPSAPNYYIGTNGGLQQLNGTDGSYLQYSVQDSLAASTFPTTLTLVQDGAVAGGVPTNTFGWVFRPGDIPAGHAPKFQIGGATWGYSHGLQTYWPDGSLKWCAFALMVPASPPSFPATVTISDGGAGTWPTASSRALTEVYNQNLVVNLKTPATAIPNNGRSADLFAALASDANNYYTVKDMDGAAGARWKFKTKAATSVGGTADPRIIVDHYIFAMNNSSGGLGGFRWFGAIRNPLRSDQAGGADGEWVAFQPPSSGSPSTGLNWSINPGGGGMVYTPVQHPFNTVNFNNGATFTGSISGSVLTVSTTPSSFIMPAATITANGGIAAPWSLVITSISSPFAINFGGGNTYGAAPAGITISGGPGAANNLFGFARQVSSSEPDGHFGGRGEYYLDNASFSGSFTNQTIILSSQLPPSYGTVGLYDGSALTGQYHIIAQLTSTEPGGTPGQRGTYALSGSAGTIGSEAMSHYGTLTVQTDVPVNWYSGSSGGNRLLAVAAGPVPPIVPGALPLSSGSLAQYPSAMQTGASGGVYSIVAVYNNQNLQVDHNSGSNNMFSGPGSGTLTPVPAFVRNSRFQIATKDGKYWFFQGTGSITADSTLRVQINQTYWQSTGTFMPMDMSLIGVIPDTGYRYDWNPYNCGVCRSVSIDDYGPPYEVGLMTSTAGIDFYVQTFNSEKENRIFGLYAGTPTSDWKSYTTVFDQVPPTYGTGTPYTGLPPALQGTAPKVGIGIATPLNNPTHEPDLGYWAFLRFGELQYFDYMVDWANQVVGAQGWNGTLPSPPFPYATYGNVIVTGQDRGIGWANRDLQKVAFICSYNPNPSAYPTLLTFNYGGTQLAQYLLDHADDQPRMVVAQVTSPSAGLFGNSAAVAYLTAHPGAWREQYNTRTDNMTGCQPWEISYFYGGMMYAALRGNADAVAILSNWMAWLDHIGNHSIQAGDHGNNGYPHFYRVAANAFSQAIGQAFVFGQGGAILMTDDSQFVGGGPGSGVTWADGTITSWVPNTGGGSAFTMNGTIKAPWYNQRGAGMPPQDNDAILCMVQQGLTIVNDGSQYPPELTLNQVYYIRDLSPASSVTGPWTFNLATTKGGPAITISSSNSSPKMFDLNPNYIPSNIDPLDSYGPDFLRQVGDSVNWIHAVAISSGPNGVNQFAGFT